MCVCACLGMHESVGSLVFAFVLSLSRFCVSFFLSFFVSSICMHVCMHACMFGCRDNF